MMTTPTVRKVNYSFGRLFLWAFALSLPTLSVAFPGEGIRYRAIGGEGGVVIGITDTGDGGPPCADCSSSPPEFAPNTPRLRAVVPTSALQSFEAMMSLAGLVPQPDAVVIKDATSFSFVGTDFSIALSRSQLLNETGWLVELGPETGLQNGFVLASNGIQSTVLQLQGAAFSVDLAALLNAQSSPHVYSLEFYNTQFSALWRLEFLVDSEYLNIRVTKPGQEY